MDIVDENSEDELGESGEENSDSESDGGETNVKLECDESAYAMYHKAETESSCLSFDILRDNYGIDRSSFPHTCYVVGGTQSPTSKDNKLIIVRMNNLYGTDSNKDNDDDGSSDDDDDEKEAEMETATLDHYDSVNRIRTTMMGQTHIAASWSANGTVYIWHLTRPLEAVNDAVEMTTYTKNEESPKAVFGFKGHQSEGYSLDWSPLIPGQLLTGDCKKYIHMWSPSEDGKWIVDQRPFTGHTDSVEDIQWSPNEKNVFASCSVDKSIRVWDTRAVRLKACQLTIPDAHDVDINVMNWNKNEPFLATGGDDGVLKIWDLRQFKKPVAVLKHHTGPITSVEWHHTDGSVFAACGADDKLTIWDLAVERDIEMGDGDNATDSGDTDVPPQLLFVHQGQTDVKELHWHSQIPGVIISTDVHGFDVFKTISV